MSSEELKTQKALIINEYLTQRDNTVKSISKRLKITINTVDRVINELLEQKKQNIGRS